MAFTALCQEALHQGIQRRPEGLLARTSNMPHEIDAPGLHRCVGEPDGREGDLHLHDPAGGREAHRAFPHGIPGHILLVLGHDHVGLHVRCGNQVFEPVATASVGVDHDVEPIAYVHIVALPETEHEAVHPGIEQVRADVHGTVVEQHAHLGVLAGGNVRPWFVLDEPVGHRSGEPGAFVQHPIDRDRSNRPKGRELLPCGALGAAGYERQQHEREDGPTAHRSKSTGAPVRHNPGR